MSIEDSALAQLSFAKKTHNLKSIQSGLFFCIKLALTCLDKV